MLNSKLPNVIRELLADKMPAQTLLDGLGLAWTPPDENGRCCLALSKKHQWELGRWVVAELSEQEVKAVCNILQAQLPGAAFATLKQKPPVVEESTRNGQKRKYSVIRLYWYAVKQASLL